MDLLPAVDLLDGRAVRLQQGDFDRATVHGDPIALTRRYVAAGARWVHIVDLDAARTGRPAHRALVGELVEAAAPAAVQVGGGIRRAEDVEALVGIGVARVVVGTWAVADPDGVAAVAERHPGRVAVGIDHRGGAVATEGWAVDGGTTVQAVLDRYAAVPLGAVVVTAIERDGMLGGPDLAGLAEVVAATELPVVASGGVATLADLRALAGLRAAGRRLAGAIVGKALVSGALDIDEAVAACAASV